MTYSIELITAVDCHGGFAKNGKIPWNCPEDFKRFAAISKEIGVCVMGKHTYLDMLEMMQQTRSAEVIQESGILTNRTSYVVSSTLKQEDAQGVTVVPDLRAVLNRFVADPAVNQRIAVIGGERLYIEALSQASVVHLTVFKESYDCDRFLPVEYIGRRFSVHDENVVKFVVDEEERDVLLITYTR